MASTGAKIKLRGAWTRLEDLIRFFRRCGRHYNPMEAQASRQSGPRAPAVLPT
jgi:hypothetical protein